MNAIFLGLLAAFLSAFFFGLNNIVARIISFKHHPKIAVPATLFLGLLITLMISIPTITRTSNPVNYILVLLYALAGILNFGIARYLFYRSVMDIGATTTGVIISGNIIMTGVLGVIFLNEPSRIQVWIGFILFLLASYLSSYTKSSGIKITRKKGLLFAFTASLIVAIVNIIIRASNISGGNPYLGLFISYSFGTLLYLFSTPKNLLEGVKLVLSLDRMILLTGTIVTLGQLLRYVSLNYIPAILAAPVLSTSMFFTVIIVGFLKQAKEKPTVIQGIGVLLGFLSIVIIYFT